MGEITLLKIYYCVVKSFVYRYLVFLFSLSKMEFTKVINGVNEIANNFFFLLAPRKLYIIIIPTFLISSFSIRHSHFELLLPSSSAFVIVYCNRGFHYLKKRLFRNCFFYFAEMIKLGTWFTFGYVIAIFMFYGCRKTEKKVFQTFAWHFLDVPFVIFKFN